MEDDDYSSFDYQGRFRTKKTAGGKGRNRAVKIRGPRAYRSTIDKSRRRRSGRRRKRPKYCPKLRRIYSYCRGCKKKKRSGKKKKRMCCQL
ncbi:unnamed protein product [Nezara viridula]|uniref:Uncharacterized protein n=1 Tax=Nezara viridula TaxID=85310 RepID=A0A9P0MP60_NEZVI|nr:unnamed protein product [Nezara viridula]